MKQDGRLSALRGRYAVVMNYHFVRTEHSSRFKLRVHEKPARFDAQLEQVSERFSFCRVRDIVDPGRARPPASVIVTFDDGAKDLVTDALPLLKRHRATATVFVCAQPYLERRLLEIQKIEFLMAALGVTRFRRAFYEQVERRFPAGVARESLDFAGNYAFYRYDDAEIRRFKIDLNYRIPYETVIPILDQLFTSVFGADAEAQAVRETYLGVDDLKRLIDAGFEIGVHTHRHRVLPRLGFDAQRREIETGVAFVAELTGEHRLSVAYPYGFHDGATRRVMLELDPLAGVTMERRMVTPDDLGTRFTLPRYDVNDCFDRATNRMIASVFSSLPDALHSEPAARSSNRRASLSTPPYERV